MARLVSTASPRIAVYTTIYPEAMGYFVPFLQSLAEQTFSGFDLWIGIDGVDGSVVRSLANDHLDHSIMLCYEGDTPQGIRASALRQIVDHYDAVVLVDSDDLLMPDRVAAASAGLDRFDLVGCGLNLINAKGDNLGGVFGFGHDRVVERLMPYVNAFGFSNTTYRCSLLRRCLTSHCNVKIMDWFIASCAWLLNGRIHFDPVARMAYRQHDINDVGVLGPFTVDRIARDMRRVLQHYQEVLSCGLSGRDQVKYEQLEIAHRTLTVHSKRLMKENGLFEEHIRLLRFDQRVPLWWEWVTGPIMIHEP